MKQYVEALQHVLDNGEERTDRTGVGTIGVFGYQMRFDLKEGFPAVTTKKLAWKACVGELLWFLEGSTDNYRLAEITHGDKTKRTIWTDNADSQGKALGYNPGELGPVYGKQWRNFGGVDQINWAINEIKTNPDSRRIIVSAWNPSELPDMALPPCHTMFQFYVSNGKLSCQLYQRSMDVGLGAPFNIASYALLTHVIASICDLEVGDFVHSVGDMHIYIDHVPALKEQIQRNPMALPKLQMPKFASIDAVLMSSVDEYILDDYVHHPTIPMRMAI
jgi:thymidylate synthase